MTSMQRHGSLGRIEADLKPSRLVGDRVRSREIQLEVERGLKNFTCGKVSRGPDEPPHVYQPYQVVQVIAYHFLGDFKLSKHVVQPENLSAKFSVIKSGES